MIKFKKVSRFENVDLKLPERKTEGSAGYDFVVAEDIIVPAYTDIMSQLSSYEFFEISSLDIPEEEKNQKVRDMVISNDKGKTLDEMAALTKRAGLKPTLVPTGVKCYLEEGTYLELSVRSSCPLKYWLILANGVGIIDADYADNIDNEGEIFFQVVNLSPFAIKLQKGDIIGQGIIKPYLITEDDCASGQRQGGFGSTNETQTVTMKIGYSDLPNLNRTILTSEALALNLETLAQSCSMTTAEVEQAINAINQVGLT